MAEAPERITIVPMTVTAGEPVWDCGEWYADLPEDMAEFAVEYVPADALAARDAEIARLTDGIARLRDEGPDRPVETAWRADGQPSKHDQCVHGVVMYEDCGSCYDAALSALIAPRPAPEDRDA